MDAQVTMPLWSWLLLAGIYFILILLDAWRGKIWTRYIESVNEYVSRRNPEGGES